MGLYNGNHAVTAGVYGQDQTNNAGSDDTRDRCDVKSISKSK